MKIVLKVKYFMEHGVDPYHKENLEKLGFKFYRSIVNIVASDIYKKDSVEGYLPVKDEIDIEVSSMGELLRIKELTEYNHNITLKVALDIYDDEYNIGWYDVGKFIEICEEMKNLK